MSALQLNSAMTRASQSNVVTILQTMNRTGHFTTTVLESMKKVATEAIVGKPMEDIKNIRVFSIKNTRFIFIEWYEWQ
jgi:hypothetical protein